MNPTNLNTQTLLNKVPEITIYFWIIKMFSTTVGETAADFLSMNLHMGLINTSYLMGLLLFVALIIQIIGKKYVPIKYRVAVVLISIVGTLLSDLMVDQFGISLVTTTTVFAVALGIVLSVWYRIERTLSITSINTRKREIFYWLTILCTFGLGTASGDLIGEGLHLGYGLSALLFLVIIGCIYGLFRIKVLHSVLSFWMIYIITRPLGASIGDLLSQPARYGGLGLGTTRTSLGFLLAIAGLLRYLSSTKIDQSA